MSNDEVAPETRGVSVQLLSTVDLGPDDVVKSEASSAGR